MRCVSGTSVKTFRKDRGSRYLSTVSALALGAMATVPLATSSAFGADAGTTGALPEITVTAQFRQQNLQQTPIAITAVTDEMMRARGQSRIMQVTQQAPNVEIKQQEANFGAATSAYIRGVGQADFNFAREPGVGMYIDDIYFPTMTGSAFEIVDLERVEILRGPQGTLAGRNSEGGSVRLITRKPTGNGPNYAEVTTGSYKDIGGRAAGEFTLADDLFARVTVAGTTKNGFVKRLDFACAHPTVAAALGIPSSGIGKADCKIGTLGGRSWVAGRAAVRWVASEKLELNFTADLTNDRSEASPTVLIDAPVNPNIPGGNNDPIGSNAVYGPWFDTPKGQYISYETFTNPVGGANGGPYSIPNINHFTGWGVALTADYQFNDMLALKSITSYRELTNDFAATTDGSPVGGLVFNELFGHSFQQEARLTGTVGSLVDFTVGGFYFTQKNTNNNRVDIENLPVALLGTNQLDFISNEVADSTSWALFAHTVWHLTDRLNLTAGLRYSDERKNQLLGRLNPADGGKTASPSFFFAELFANGGYAPNVIWSGTRVDYRAGLDYQLTDSFMVYASTSTGYKSGGVSPRFYFVSHILPYNEEQVTAYEAGFKTDLFDRRVRVNGAVFLSDYTDQQVPAPGSVCPGLTPPAPCIADFNLVDSLYWGAELEVNIQPAADTIIDLSGSYIAAKYTNGTGAIEKAADATFIDHPDAPPGIPQWKFSVGAQHSFEVGGRGSITPRVDMNYESARKPNVTTALITPARTLANASLTWRSEDKSWETRFEVSNLFDKYYYVNIFDARSAGGAADALPGEPREWKLTIRRSF